MPPSLRRLLLRAPFWATLAGIVLVSVAASVGMLFALNAIMGIGIGPTFRRSLTIAVVAPILVSAPIGGLIVRLLHEVETARRAAHDLAFHDPLTGLLNRRRFTEVAQEAIAAARAAGRPLAAVLLDLDDFKLVNDRHGHAGGDRLLQAVARCLGGGVRGGVRGGDAVARWGGEEFALLLQGADAEGAAQVMQRVRAAVAALRVEGEAGAFGCTASIGIATLGAGGFDDLFVRADKAMYRAKRGGKNRVMLAEAA